jgi:hypothetical protein
VEQAELYVKLKLTEISIERGREIKKVEKFVYLDRRK